MSAPGRLGMLRWKRKIERKGYALIIALAALLLVTFLIGVLENTLVDANTVSHAAVASVQADWACHGAVMRALANPPDSLTRFDFHGTRVQVTVHKPPINLLARIMEGDSAALVQDDGGVTVRMYCAVASSPAEGESEGDATWYYVVKETRPPQVLTSWPGVERSQPYE
ncbi:MAG: hypothetical protein HUU16_09280 [Candidatus Omnitrophica bacterium]|nr:hypothetical protein [bacterium]NUN96352.1 hypothetical protein [Candidatus Omnitrophota bacterium]